MGPHLLDITSIHLLISSGKNFAYQKCEDKIYFWKKGQIIKYLFLSWHDRMLFSVNVVWFIFEIVIQAFITMRKTIGYEM